MGVSADIRTTAIAITLLSLCACAGTGATWVKEGTTAEETNSDRLECERKARTDVEFRYPQSTYGSTTGGSGTNVMAAELQQFNLCMKGKGYTELPSRK